MMVEDRKIDEFYSMATEFCEYILDNEISEQDVDYLLSTLMKLYAYALELPHIELEYEDGYLRRASLSIANIAPDGMIYSNSYSKLYFVEDKERDEVYVSTDGFHYDLIPLNEKDNVTAKAYRWMLAWLRPQEKL